MKMVDPIQMVTCNAREIAVSNKTMALAKMLNECQNDHSIRKF